MLTKSWPSTSEHYVLLSPLIVTGIIIVVITIVAIFHSINDSKLFLPTVKAIFFYNSSLFRNIRTK